MESLCGLKYGAIKDITIGNDAKKSSDQNQTILVRLTAVVVFGRNVVKTMIHGLSVHKMHP